MSEQMERNILKILEKVENLEKNQEKLEKNQEKLEKNQEKLEKNQEKLEYNQEKQVSINEEFRNEFKKLNDKIETIQNNLDYVSTDLRNFSRHFVVFEDEFGRKVDLLFENYDTDFKEHKKFKKDIDSLKNHSFKHDVQIEHLSKKIANA